MKCTRNDKETLSANRLDPGAVVPLCCEVEGEVEVAEEGGLIGCMSGWVDRV